MAWTNIAKRVVGKSVPKSWLDTFIDNLTHLYNLAGGAGTGAGGSLINGSFENDVDSNGVPDGWTWMAYTGGSLTLDSTDQTHGAKSVKITSPGGSGNGGGYLETTDFLIVSPREAFIILPMLKSSAAGVHNEVEAFWFDKDKNACSTLSTTLYDSAVNPTSWTATACATLPPSDARFAKIRLTGCKNDTPTAGSTWFDGLELHKQLHQYSSQVHFPSVPEAAGTSIDTFVDVGSPITVPLGAAVAGDTVVVRFDAEVKNDGIAAAAYQRFRYGTNYSNAAGPYALGSYQSNGFTLTFTSAGESSISIQQQLHKDNTAGTVYGRKTTTTAVVVVTRGAY